MLATVDQLEVKALPQSTDPRGLLVPVELPEFVPFAISRLFWIKDVPMGLTRGGHAHKRCHQFMMCVHGEIAIDTFDGASERRFLLGSGDALHVPPAIFATESYLAADAVLLVLCDRPYEKDDYLADYRALNAFRSIGTDALCP